MVIFLFTVIKSLGGRSARYTWSNTYYVRIAASLADPILREIASFLVDAEATAHLSEVDFLRVVYHQVADNALNRPAKDFVSIAFDVKGTRQTVGAALGGALGAESSNPLLPLEHTLEISRSAATGHGGFIRYRGCLLQADVHTGRDNSFTLVDPSIFGTLGGGGNVIINALSAPMPGDGVFVLPNLANVPGDPLSYFVQSSRDVISHRVGGVVYSKRTRNRRSARSEAVRAAQRQVNGYGRDMRQLADKVGGVANLAGDLLAVYNEIKNSAIVLRAGLPALEAAEVILPFALL
jgi:hypothetical protein